MQKTDTAKIYAMKTLKKEEMLKKDQVRIVGHSLAVACCTELPVSSLHTFARNEMYWQSRTLPGSCSSITLSRTLRIYI